MELFIYFINSMMLKLMKYQEVLSGYLGSPSQFDVCSLMFVVLKFYGENVGNSCDEPIS